MTGRFLDLAAIKDRLRTELDPALLAAAYLLAESRIPESPIATLDRVVLLTRTATEVEGPAGLGRGRMLTEHVGIVIQVRNYRQDQGSDADTDGTELRDAVCTALDGWRPAAEWGPLLYQGGKLLDAEAPMYRWLDEYLVQRATYLP
jgi:hypothetical protein